MDFLKGLVNKNEGKVLSEVDQMTENIARTEREIQQKIFQLGQMYYEEYKDKGDTGDKFYNLMDAIIKLDLNRQSFFENKLRLQGQMICANCGKLIPYGSVFCSFCGKKANEKQEGDDSVGTEVKKCANCGTVLDEGSMFCTTCGTKVE